MSHIRRLKQFALHVTLMMHFSSTPATVLAFCGFEGLSGKANLAICDYFVTVSG